MLTLIIVILGVILGICIRGFCKTTWNYENDAKVATYGIFGIIAAILEMIVIAIWICSLYSLSTVGTIDQQIKMYEEENYRIESSVSKMVEEYMNYENDIYKEMKYEELTVAVAMIPELKSDALVQEEIGILKANNEQIKSLKKQRINVEKEKWWLYFKVTKSK